MDGVERFHARLLIALRPLSNLGCCGGISSSERENTTGEISSSGNGIVLCLKAENVRRGQIQFVGFSSANDGKQNVRFDANA